jgi:predicted O-methyltransferase YrrM
MSGTFAKPMVLELGTSLGISTMYLAAAVPDTKVYTIEGCRATSEIAASNFSEAGFSNIELFNGSFEEILPVIKKESIAPGLAYIDGSHRKEPLLRYFDQIAEMADNNTVVIIDDINDSTEMAEAWDEIKNKDKVTCSVDIFRMGIVFFRKGPSRIHYVVRY